MSHIINFTFLFLANKKNMLKLFLVLFYVSAGLIKFNTDWFSGQALTNPSFFSGYLLVLACTYVVILEMIFSWLLLASNRKIFWFALFQICLFHIFSWHIVGYFYPIIMFALISLFFIQRDLFRFPKDLLNRCFIALFIIAQVIPFAIDKNSSLTNHYRVYSLNMLDAYSVCESRFFIKKTDVTIEYKPNLSQFSVRVHCDPIVLLSLLTKTCQDQASLAGFIDIDVDHQVRRKSDFSNIHQQSFANVCTNKLKIDRLSGGLYQ
ncbi:MAG: hypothetical protein H7328_09595 [Bdellovibrio sp.]|nr:hypothetical protein [Bdellovibrio sp.]